MSNIQYSVILPCYQEAENLEELLPRLNQVMKSLSATFEILIIDTLVKMDDTASVCSKNQAKCINRSPTNCYADAVRTGVNVAQGEWIIFMDADGSHPPEFIPSMISQIDNADLVIASRYMYGGDSENNFLLVFMSKLLNIVYAKLLKINCHDVSNSLRIYRTSLLKQLKLTCQNFDVVEEIIFKLKQQFPQIKIVEVPFTFKKRFHGKSKRSLLVFIASYLTTLVKLVCHSKKTH